MTSKIEPSSTFSDQNQSVFLHNHPKAEQPPLRPAATRSPSTPTQTSWDPPACRNINNYISEEVEKGNKSCKVRLFVSFGESMKERWFFFLLCGGSADGVKHSIDSSTKKAIDPETTEKEVKQKSVQKKEERKKKKKEKKKKKKKFFFSSVLLFSLLPTSFFSLLTCEEV